MLKSSLAIAKSAAGLLAVCLLALPAKAGDVFSHSTTSGKLPTSANMTAPSIGAGPGAMMSANTSIVRWFENFDKTIENGMVTQEEKEILARPMNKEVERVEQMTKAYSQIAKRYRGLAASLRAMPVQADWPGVKEYRNAKADFFLDEAQVYEDLIKPQAPAHTIEDLNDQLGKIEQRSEILKKNGVELLAIDHQLRQKYSVHAARPTDPLWKYISHKNGMPSK